IRSEREVTTMTAKRTVPFLLVAGTVAAVVAGCDAKAPAASAAPPPAAPATTAYESVVNIRLVAHDDLQARSAYQPVIHRYGDRYILFVGHHVGLGMNPQTGAVEKNGLSIVDVTTPNAPQYLAHMPPTGDDANGTQHVQVCDGRELAHGDPAKVYAIRTNGQIGYEVLDVTDPAKPAFLTTIAATGTSSRPKSDRGNRETHKFQWDCSTGVA